MHITTNKNSLIGDKSALTPGGIRLGTPALTTRGMLENEMEKVAEVLIKALAIAKKVQEKSKGKKLVEFIEALDEEKEAIKLLADEVKAFAE